MLVDSSNPTAGSAVIGAIRQAAQATGTSFQYLLATAQVESGPQSAGRRVNVVGARPVPVHRADLARDHEAIGRGARLWPICRRHHQDRVRQLRGAGSGDAQRNSQAAQRSDRERGHGGRLHQGERDAAVAEARPLAERGRALYRAFSRRRRRGEADLGGRRQSERVAPRAIFRMPRTPIRRSSTIARPARRAASRRCATCSPRATTSRRGSGRSATTSVAQADIAPSAAIPPAATSSLAPPSPVDATARFRSTVPIAIPPSECRCPTAAKTAAAAVPDTAGMTSAFAAATPQRAAANTEMFHGLFSDPGRTTPVAAVVSQLWGVSGARPDRAADDGRSVQGRRQGG